ncbi:glucose-6-phosphate exchanger SLC37A2 isoform X1 [Ischnura elegans]|uniref:glucose-6-phosphate exchanger SLC37A2 isoform X1 n=1 Tax=Ischnura elegans TaxID=197161 RepID=UPI001ED87F88|nr:glucose-6-phosphate exchanger SLC37A2 isoform X1 [Ischnura elegans]
MDSPPGLVVVKFLREKVCRVHGISGYRASVFVLTYLSYTGYHLSRKPISVVKNVLHQNCSSLTPPVGVNDSNWCNWAPFDGSDGPALLGTLDSAFLFAYGIAMFFSGFVAERVNLRYFLSLGMILSGIFIYLFGIAHSYGIHSLWYFIIIQALGGIVQTSGWPGVVTCMGNWFGKGKRGLIMGAWNSHTSMGNILGSLIAGAFVETDWGLSFYVPALIMGVLGLLLFLFLVTDPSHVGSVSPNVPTSNPPILTRRGGYQSLLSRSSEISYDEVSSETDSEFLIGKEDGPSVHRDGSPILAINNDPPSEAIGFVGALKIPGVIEFSLSLFFSKLVSYTFLYWLPLYIASSSTMGAAASADLSTLFDIGGILGGIVAGIVSDYTGRSATTCAVMLTSAIPMLFVYQAYGSSTLAISIVLLVIVGALVNGPYSLITTAVSAELGTHHSLKRNSKALATVTAIIDGTGSIGAAVGPLLAGLVSSSGWNNVFYMLMGADLLALMLLVRLSILEFKRQTQENRIHTI